MNEKAAEVGTMSHFSDFRRKSVKSSAERTFPISGLLMEGLTPRMNEFGADSRLLFASLCAAKQATRFL